MFLNSLTTERMVLVGCDVVDRNVQLGRMCLISEQGLFVRVGLYRRVWW